MSGRLASAALYLPSVFAAVLLVFAANMLWLSRDELGPLTFVHLAAVAVPAALTLASQVLLLVARGALRRDGRHVLQPAGAWSLGQLVLLGVLGSAPLAVVLRAGPIGLYLGAALLLAWAAWVGWCAGLGRILRPRLSLENLQSTVPGQENLESLVGSGGFLDPYRLVALLQDSVLHVCRIEAPTPSGTASGTGLLVGPDLVLTCMHVVDETFAAGLDDQLRVHLRGAGEDGLRLAATGALVWSSGKRDLDAALLRLARRPGDDVMEEPSRAPGGPVDRFPRGHIDLARVGQLAAGGSVLILQHPGGGPLRYAQGPVASVEAPVFHHKVDALGGSSGAPCFAMTMQLAGLHRQGVTPDAPLTNKGILIGPVASAVLAALAALREAESAQQEPAPPRAAEG